jgi:nucleoside 2-deoxyribosyltransferase
MKIYTAATFSEQARIRENREILFKLGHQVLSTWLDEQIKPEGMTEDQFGRKMAAKDLREVASADCLILDLTNPSKTAGKMVETGFAIANHKLFYVVGEIMPGGIFMLLADRHFNNWDELFSYFKEAHPSTFNKYIDLSKSQHVKAA